MGPTIGTSLRNYTTRRALDSAFESQSVTASDGRRVCPRCRVVSIQRSKYNQVREGGWSAVCVTPGATPVVACQVCRVDLLKPTGQMKKNAISRDRLLKEKYKAKQVKGPGRKNRKTEWVPQKTKKKSGKLNKTKYTISPADRVRMKAAKLKGEYRL